VLPNASLLPLCSPLLLCLTLAAQGAAPAPKKVAPQAGPPMGPQAGPQARPSLPRQGVGTGANPHEDKKNPLPLYPFTSDFQFWTHQIDYRLEDELRTGLRKLLAYYNGGDKRGTDKKGRPFVEHPRFAELRDELLPKLRRSGGWFAQILKDARSIEDRRLAAFGLFFCGDVQNVIWGIAYGAYEPQDVLRRQFLDWSYAFVNKALGERFSEEDAKNVYPPTPENRQRVQEGKLRYELVHVHTKPVTYERTVVYWTDTWLNMLRAPKAQERILAMRMLTTVAQLRPTAAVKTLERGRTWIESSLTVGNDGVRAATRDFVTALDPENPCPEESEAARAHFRALLDKIFPEIEVVGGLGKLYDGDQLQQIVKLGAELLRTSRAGYPARGKTKRMGREVTIYGVKLNPLPKELEVLDLPTGTLIHSLGGTPVRSCAELLQVLRAKVKAKSTAFVIEYLDPDGEAKVRRYVRKGKRF
jgi:hypothetical protein